MPTYVLATPFLHSMDLDETGRTFQPCGSAALRCGSAVLPRFCRGSATVPLLLQRDRQGAKIAIDLKLRHPALPDHPKVVAASHIEYQTYFAPEIVPKRFR